MQKVVSSLRINYTILFCSILLSRSSIAQTHQIELKNLELISREEKVRIKQLLVDDNAEVYASSCFTDSLFLRMINQCRGSENPSLQRLHQSVRLDTIARIVARQIVASGVLAHYTAFPELGNLSDLLNIENIAYNISSNALNATSFEGDGESNDVVNISTLLDSWIKSPPHRINLLSDADLGSVTVLLRITRRFLTFVLETVVVFEADYFYSKREINQLLKRKNFCSGRK